MIQNISGEFVELFLQDSFGIDIPSEDQFIPNEKIDVDLKDSPRFFIQRSIQNISEEFFELFLQDSFGINIPSEDQFIPNEKIEVDLKDSPRFFLRQDRFKIFF